MATLTERAREAEEKRKWQEEQIRIAGTAEEAEKQRLANEVSERRIKEMEEKQRQQGGGEQKG